MKQIYMPKLVEEKETDLIKKIYKITLLFIKNSQKVSGFGKTSFITQQSTIHYDFSKKIK